MRRFFLAVVGIVVGAIAAGHDGLSQTFGGEADSQLKALRGKRDALTAQIAARQASLAEADPAGESSAAADDDTLSHWRALDAMYVRQQTLLEQRGELEAQVKQAEKDLARLDDFKPDEPKPYSFLLFESLQDQLAVEEDRQEAIETDLKSAEQLLKAAHAELDQAAADRREKSSGKPAEKPSGKASADRERRQEVDRAELENRAKIALQQSDIEVQKQRLELCKTTQKQLEAKIAVVKKDVKFTALDRDKQLERIAARDVELKRRRREAENQLQQLAAADKADLQELTGHAAAASEIETAKVAWRGATEAFQSQIVLLDEQLENSGELRRVWKHRFELSSDKVEVKSLARWLDDAVDLIEQLTDLSHAVEHRRDTLRDLHSTRSGTQHSPSSEHAAAQSSRAAGAMQSGMQEFRDLCDAMLADNKANERMLRRYKGELKEKIKAATGWGNSIGEFAGAVLAYEVAGEGSDAVTVQKILVLLAYVTAGILLAYVLSRLLGHRLLPRLGIHMGRAAAFKSIAFYTLCVVFGVAAFQLLHIPLAAFAFLGGAAAIAIGFGSQDIMNNFMSGIILLVEQPIRVGDFVQLSSVQGVVLHIGLRSTRLQTDSNHELIVPNKTLLDEQVTNLTLTDNFVQTFVTISVDRDVPLQKAKSDMLRIAFLHPMILKSPRPFVLLKEVDSYWMTFEIHFCMQYQSFIKSAVVQSEILEKISDLFTPAPNDTSATDVDDATEAATSEIEIAAADSVSTPDQRSASLKVPTMGKPAADAQVLGTIKKIGSRAMIKQMQRLGGSAIMKR